MSALGSIIGQRLLTLLERTPPFDQLTPDERQELLSRMYLENYNAGDVILEQGTDVHRALYIVESGRVRLMDVAQQRLLDMCGEGSQFGAYGLVQGGVMPYEAKAIEPTWCALLPADDFWRLYKANRAFASYFDDDVKRYVLMRDTDLDPSGAFLLFDTPLADVIYQAPVICSPSTTVRRVARAMRDEGTDTVIVAKDGLPMGIVTEGDLCKRILAEGRTGDTEIGDLIDRPPTALNSTERLFDAMQVMMHHRIRRVIVMQSGGGDSSLLGLVSSQDIAHFRGLDPIATVERIEKARSVAELAAIRTESNRRLLRLYQQGVHSENLMDVISELDDQLKSRLFHLVEREVRLAHPEAVVEMPWAWLAFGAAGRRESSLHGHQDNGLVYADPRTTEEARRAAYWFELLSGAFAAALKACGFVAADPGIRAEVEPYRQPLTAWRSAFRSWIDGGDPSETVRTATCFDLRAIHGETALADDLRATIRTELADDHTALVSTLMNAATQIELPLTFFGRRFKLERNEFGETKLDLRQSALRPIVAMARALALDVHLLKPTNTFARLRYATEALPDVATEARGLFDAFATLTDLHLRTQMLAAEVGEPASDYLDPEALSRSQQNLLREALQLVEDARQSLRNRYVKRNGRR